MRREGNRNFGVWNPPTGMDDVRRSVQVDFELIVRSNHSILRDDLIVGQIHLSLPRVDLRLSSEFHSDLIVFTRMRQEGWQPQQVTIPVGIVQSPLSKYPPPGSLLPMPDFPAI